MPESSDRDRILDGYATEIRAFHTFFAAVLLAVGAFHFLLLLPLIQVRAALPAITGQLRSTEQELEAVAGAQQAAAAAATAVTQFRRAQAAAPEELRRTIAELVARGRTVAGPAGDPYKVEIRVPRESAPPGAAADEGVTVEEAIRRHIGKQMEALSLSFERALEPLRTARNTSARTLEILRETQETVSREIQAELNKALQEAFGVDEHFWQRWERLPSLGAASPQTEEAIRRIGVALRLFLDRMGRAAVEARAAQPELQARLVVLQARERALNERLERIAAATARVPLAPDEWARLYPLVVGALSLTVLFRVRRLLALRRALTAVDLDDVAPSWAVPSSSSPGRLWSLGLLAVPLMAAVHGAATVIVDPGQFTTVLGESSPVLRAAYALGYAALVLSGLWQFAAVAHGVLGAPGRHGVR